MYTLQFNSSKVDCEIFFSAGRHQSILLEEKEHVSIRKKRIVCYSYMIKKNVDEIFAMECEHRCVEWMRTWVYKSLFSLITI
jgi:hypothetical protein